MEPRRFFEQEDTKLRAGFVRRRIRDRVRLRYPDQLRWIIGVTPRLSTLALLTAFVALVVFSALQVREVQNLRAELVAEAKWTARPAARSTPGSSAMIAAVKPTAAPPAASYLPRRQLAGVLDTILRTQMWHFDPAHEAELLRRISPTDLPLAFRLLQAYPVSESRRAVQFALLQRWAASDPASAAAAADLLPTPEIKAAKSMVAMVWAKRDPAAAVRLSSSNPIVWYKYAAAAPKEAAAAALALTGPQQQLALNFVAESWFRKDPVAAWAWVSGLPPAQQRSAAWRLIPQMARIDPATVASYLASSAAAAQYGWVAQEVTSAWSAQNPEAAATWAIGLPEGSPLRQSAEAGVVRGIAATDPAAARQWVESLPSADRVQARSDFINAVVEDEPALAATVALEQPAATLRSRELLIVTSRWLREDPTSAKAWIAQNGIADDTRRALERMKLLDVPGRLPSGP